MSEQIKNTVVIIIVFFAALFLYTKIAGPLPFFVQSVQTTKTDLFQTTGEGKVTAIPDTADISLGITKEASTVGQAQTEANSVVNKIVADLKNIGVEEKNIQTSDYSVSPQYDTNQTVTGYAINQTIEAKITPIEKANQAIDLATKDGANVVGGVQFILNDQTQKDLEQKARDMAVADAKQKAQSLAKAAGINLGRIVDVQENTNGLPIKAQPLALGGAEPNNQTQLNPGQNTVDITVTLSYETF